MRSPLILFLIVALTGCEYSYKIGGGEKTEPGRYAIHENGGQTYLLDTSTGITWRQVTMRDHKMALMSVFWEPMTKFDTDVESTSHIKEVESYVEIKKQNSK